MGLTTVSLACVLLVNAGVEVAIDQPNLQTTHIALTQQRNEVEVIREEVADLKRTVRLLIHRIEILENRLERLEHNAQGAVRGVLPKKSLLEEHWERNEPFYWDGLDRRPAPENRLPRRRR